MAMMNRVHWIVVRCLERLGLPGYALLMLMVISLFFYFFAWAPLKASYHEQLVNKSVILERTVQQSPEQELNAFISLFPTSEHRLINIETVISKADEIGLGIDNIAYSSSKSQGDLLSHYHVDFILVGEYPALREFLASLLHELPMISLDKLELYRQDVEQEFVQARVRLTMHYS